MLERISFWRDICSLRGADIIKRRFDRRKHFANCEFSGIHRNFHEMFIFRGRGAGEGEAPQTAASSATTRHYRYGLEVTYRIVLCRSISFRAFGFELQRGVGIGRIFVSTKAFVDGLEKRSAAEGVQIFNLNHAIDRGQQFASWDGDISDLDEAFER